jgi:sugar phosphate isomerase/epimerase
MRGIQQRREVQMAKEPMLELAVQTFTFLHWKEHADVIAAVKSCGFSSVELSGFHFDPSQGDPAALLRQYRENGVSIIGFGVQVFGKDEAADRKTLELAKLGGFSTISATFPLGADIQKTDRLATEWGKKLAVHNHGRKDRYGSVQALEDLFSRTSETIGLCLDTAWAMDSGDDPLQVAKRFRKRLYSIHLKDFVFDRAGRPADVVVGTGNLDLPGLLRFLKETDFDGSFILEYEGGAEDPLPATKACVEAFRAAANAI